MNTALPYHFSQMGVLDTHIVDTTNLITSEWIKAVNDKEHLAHIASVKIEETTVYSDNPPQIQIHRSAHLPQIIDDLLTRPIWTKVMSHFDSSPTQREAWNLVQATREGVLIPTAFQPEHLVAQSVPIIDMVAEYMQTKIENLDQFPKNMFRYALTDNGKLEAFNFGLLAHSYMSPLQKLAENQLRFYVENDDIQEIVPNDDLMSSAKFLTNGVTFSKIPYGIITECDETISFPNIPKAAISVIKSESSQALELDEELLASHISRAIGNVSNYSREKVIDKIQSYTGTGKDLMRNTDLLQMVYTGLLYPQKGCYDEGATGVLVSDGAFHPQAHKPTPAIFAETKHLARSLYDKQQQMAADSKEVLLRNDTKVHQITHHNHSAHLPSIEITPFAHIQATREGLIGRIADTLVGEESEQNSYQDKTNYRNGLDDESGL